MSDKWSLHVFEGKIKGDKQQGDDIKWTRACYTGVLWLWHRFFAYLPCTTAVICIYLKMVEIKLFIFSRSAAEAWKHQLKGFRGMHLCLEPQVDTLCFTLSKESLSCPGKYLAGKLKCQVSRACLKMYIFEGQCCLLSSGLIIPLKKLFFFTVRNVTF